MAEGSLPLHLDQLSEVSQRELDTRVGLAEGSPLYGVLEELAGKSRLVGEAGIAPVGRLPVARVKVSRGACGDPSAPGGGGVSG